MTTLGVLTNSAIHLLIKISVQLQHCATSFLCIDHVPDWIYLGYSFTEYPPPEPFVNAVQVRDASVSLRLYNLLARANYQRGLRYPG